MPSHRTLAAVLCGVCLAGAGLTAPAAATVPAAQTALASAATPDFDGDGKADVAWVGAQDGDTYPLHIHYGSGTDQTITLQGATLESITAGDLNADGRTDLAYVSYTEMGPADITVLHGSPSGLDPASAQDISKGDADGGFTGVTILSSPKPRLVAGYEDEGSVGGSLFSYVLDSTGQPVDDTLPIWAVGAGLHGFDRLGSVLAHVDDVLVAGAPGDRVAGKDGAGALEVAQLGLTKVQATQLITRNSRGVAGTAVKNGGFGNTIAAADGYVVVGMPGDKVKGAAHAGSVLVFRVSGNKLVPMKQLTQASAGVPGTPERNDRFGAAVALGEVCDGVPGVVVGAPGEALAKGHKNDGAVWLIPLTRSKACPATMLSEGHGLSGQPTSHRNLGAQVATVQDAGATTSTVVVGGDGLLAAWSPATRTTVFSSADQVTTIVR